MQTVRRVRIGKLEVDPVTLDEAVERIGRLVASGFGGTVYVPGVDHVLAAEAEPRLTCAYQEADLSLPGAVPLLWASRVLRTPVPARVSAADLWEPLMRRAAAHRWKVYLLCGEEGAGQRAASSLRELGVEVAGQSAPWIEDPTRERMIAPLATAIRDSGAALVLVSLGAPREELFIRTARRWLRGAVMIGVGASLNLGAGPGIRAPRWLRRPGLQLLYRLATQPRGQWRRSLSRDPRFAMIIARQRREARRAPALPFST